MLVAWCRCGNNVSVELKYRAGMQKEQIIEWFCCCVSINLMKKQ